jgi:hypothetical protein
MSIAPRLPATHVALQRRFHMNTTPPSTPTANKKTYKVLCPIEKPGGGPAYWMRLGTAFTNRDDSLNVVLDAIPPTNTKSGRYQLHIREFNDEDLRRRETYNSSRGSSYGGASHATNDGSDVGIGGPTASSRAVTASSSLAPNASFGPEHGGETEDVPF